MSSQLAMSAMSVAEFALWATLGFLFWKRKLYRRFPDMAAYLALRVASMPTLMAAFYIQSQPWGRSYYAVYFFAYWTVYITSAVLLLLVCVDARQRRRVGAEHAGGRIQGGRHRQAVQQLGIPRGRLHVLRAARQLQRVVPERHLHAEIGRTSCRASV